jgi:hypothetical protein
MRTEVEMTKTQRESKCSAKELFERLCGIREQIESIARDYVASLDANPGLRQEMLDLGVTNQALYRLESIGRGQLLPQLYDASYYAANHVRLLPLSLQREVLENGVDVMGEDEQTIRKIPVEDLTPRQARRVLRAGRVVSLAEQRSIIIKEKADAPKPRNGVGVKIQRGSVFIGQPGIYTKAEILGWLARM